MKKREVKEFDVFETVHVSESVPYLEAAPHVAERRDGEQFVILRCRSNRFGLRWSAALMRACVHDDGNRHADFVTVGFGVTKRGALKTLSKEIRSGDECG